ncbi:MAG TPA: trehalose-phosphatase, partial [Candidatus Binatus sp.]|nr:trehalose-phosphatase [Candidatus Binatus sp.]
LMQRRLKRYNVTRWANDFLGSLMGVRETQSRIESKLLSTNARREAIARFHGSKRRMLFFDYDGTLTPLVPHPSMARPDLALRELLRTLGSDPRNDVVITSGRDRITLEDWFGALPLGLVAEHGAWLKRAGQSWQRAKMVPSEWKHELLPILEIYADRLPGSFVEEKEESMAWHYRLADPEQSELCAPELVDHLFNLTAKSDLQVVQGNKVVEIRRAGIDKGSAAAHWLGDAEFDFILAVGDDATDEDLFKSLPPSALSIRVGIAATHAQYNLGNCAQVLDLLRLLTATPPPATPPVEKILQ